MNTDGILTKDVLSEMRSKFYEDPKNIVAQNACVKTDPAEASISRQRIETINNVFSHKIELEGKPFTNQKSSGRCWIFAALNTMRISIMKQYNIEEIEFSQSHLFFWDKVERCNYFLHNIVKSTKNKEKVDGRLFSFLLRNPMEDGGQWDMLLNLINKHGVMPKTCFPETFSSETTMRMNSFLTSKLREYSVALRNLVKSGADEKQIQAKICEQMTVIYKIIGTCLSIPPETFTWEYYDKTKNYHSIGPVSATEFYEKFIKPYFNFDEKVCLVTDPRSSNPFGKLYTLDYLGNVVGGKLVLYNNQPSELLLKLCAESIKNNEPVWFGSEVNKRGNMKLGILDLKLHDFKSVFGTDFQITLSKADRLRYGESFMTHAMVFTGASFDKDGNVTKLRIENSWGEDRGEKGYFVCTAEWFHEFVFEAVIDKKYVPADVLSVFDQKPIVLPAWDPMGTLAN